MKMMQLIHFCSTVLLTLFMSSCAHSPLASRVPASDAESDLLRTGTLTLSNQQGTGDYRLILIAVDRKNAGGMQEFDAEALGFKSPKGISLQNVDPKFLISEDPEGAQEVYSFELGGFFEKREWLKTDDGKDSSGRSRYYVNLHGSDSSRALPKVLLDAPKTKRTYLLREAIWATLAAVELAPNYFASSIATLLDIWFQNSLAVKNYQAAYLQFLLSEALDDNHASALLDVFTKSQLEELGADLNEDYHPKGGPNSLSPIFTTDNTKIDLYDTLRQVRAETNAENMAKLVEVANEHNIVLIPLTSSFALAFYDDKSLAGEWAKSTHQFLLDSKAPVRIEREKYKNLSLPKGVLRPIGIFSLDQSHAPAEVLDFNYPDKLVIRENVKDVLKICKEMAVAFMPSITYSLSIDVVDGVVKFFFGKAGSTFFDDPVRSNAELQALLETGMAQINLDGVIEASLIENLRDLHVSEDTISDFKTRLATRDPAQAQRTTDDLVALMGGQENAKRIFIGKGDREIYDIKLANWLRLQHWLGDDEKRQKLLAKLQERHQEATRKPSSETIVPKDQAGRDLKPVIFVMADGVRPDRLAEAAQRGLVPTIKSLFLDHGTELNSYVSRSLTLPSWSTILTGTEPDVHGVRSNSPVSRIKGESSDNFEDPRRDLLLPNYMISGRIERRLHESGVPWMAEYFSGGNQSVQGFTPVISLSTLPVEEIIGDLPKDLPKLINGSLAGSIAFDQASAERIAKKIKQNPGKNRLVVFWYSSVDHLEHMSSGRIDEAFKGLDRDLSTILTAAAKDPVLKDATVFMVSDHGHSGGPEPQDSTREHYPYKHFMVNTGFNLVKYFAGDYDSATSYHFTVGSDASPDPDYDLTYLKEWMIQPYKYTYSGRFSQDERHIVVDYAGDALSQIYVRPQGEPWGRRLSFYELSHYQFPAPDPVINIPGDLLSRDLRNVVATESNLRSELFAVTGNRPVQFFAMALPGDTARKSAESLTQSDLSLSRDPIIIQSYPNKTGMVLFHLDPSGEELMRYVVISNFNQDADGHVSGTLSTDPADDPIGYLKAPHFADAKWRTDQQWLDFAYNLEFPTAVFSLVRALTLSPSIASDVNRAAEIPDFILVSNYGFNFNCSENLESDHGGLARIQSHDIFLIGGIGSAHKTVPTKKIDAPVLSRDVLPTVLDYAGFSKSNPLWRPNWRSLKPLIEAPPLSSNPQ